MKFAKIALIIVLIFSLVSWVRSDHGDFGSLVKTLPFCGGHKVSFYDVGAIALIVLLFWGLSRLKSSGQKEDDAADSDYEYEEDGGWEQDEATEDERDDEN